MLYHGILTHFHVRGDLATFLPGVTQPQCLHSNGLKLRANYCSMLELSSSMKRLVKIGPRRLGFTRVWVSSPRATSLLRLRLVTLNLIFLLALFMSSARISSYGCGGVSLRFCAFDELFLVRFGVCPRAVWLMCDFGFSGMALLL